MGPPQAAISQDDLWAELEQPLMLDHEQRLELENRLSFHLFGRANAFDQDLIDKQLDVEKKIESALRQDGYSQESILLNRNKIGGYMFYPNGEPVKERTLDTYFTQFERNIRESTPYTRIQKAKKEYALSLSSVLKAG